MAFNLCKSISADKYAKKAQDEIKASITSMLKDEDVENIKVKAKAIGKNKDAGLYCFDVTATGKYQSEKFEYTSFVIVLSDSDMVSTYREFEYDKETKDIEREMALAALSRG